MMLDSVVGNSDVVADLKNSLLSGKFMHSVLLCGEAGVGTDYTARCLAADFLYERPGAQNGTDDDIITAKMRSEGICQVMAGTSPEYLCLKGTGVSGIIHVDDVRNVRKSIFGTALSASGRVVHIQGSQNLNASGANALLKVLEEPPQDVLFILTAPVEAAVLPTLRSRCARYTLSPVTSEQCENYLLQKCAHVDNIGTLAKECAAIFGGKIGLGLMCICDENGQKLLKDAKKALDLTIKNNEYGVLKLFCEYEKERTVTIGFLEFFIQVCASTLRDSAQSSQAKVAANAIHNAKKAILLLNSNVSAKLVLTCLAQKIATAA